MAGRRHKRTGNPSAGYRAKRLRYRSEHRQEKNTKLRQERHTKELAKKQLKLKRKNLRGFKARKLQKILDFKKQVQESTRLA